MDLPCAHLPAISRFFCLRSASSASAANLASSTAPCALALFFMNARIFLSCSMSLVSSRHSFSNASCSLSACCLSFAISLTALSRASYALSDRSMISPILFFFSASSCSSFLYMSSKSTRSLRRLSMVPRSCLLCARASLYLPKALSSLFSSIFRLRWMCVFFSCAASTPPISRRCSMILARTRSMPDSTSFVRRFSNSMRRVSSSAWVWSLNISPAGPLGTALSISLPAPRSLESSSKPTFAPFVLRTRVGCGSRVSHFRRFWKDVGILFRSRRERRPGEGRGRDRGGLWAPVATHLAPPIAFSVDIVEHPRMIGTARGSRARRSTAPNEECVSRFPRPNSVTGALTATVSADPRVPNFSQL